MWTMLCAVSIAAVQWQHPAGMIAPESLQDAREKIEQTDWAKKQYEGRKQQLAPWLDASSEEMHKAFPKKCGNVYHNFSCPADRHKLEFDPLEYTTFTCPECKKTYPADTDAGIYPAGERYKGTMYDGWACLFYLNAAAASVDLATMATLEDNAACRNRAKELLIWFADTIDGLQVTQDADPQMRKLLTYHREGDNKVLFDLTQAYELLRGGLQEDERKRIEQSVITRMLNDCMLEPIYRYDHNNVYQWHRTIVQAALALEREDLIDWSFGYGDFSPEKQPDHRSVRRILAKHFKPDGAYWELCSGYHLYPLYHLCELAVLSHHLSAMDPARFEPAQYDLTLKDSEGGKVIFNGLHWFLSLAMPNRRMPTIGDSMLPEAGMDDYNATAETGYRFFDIAEIGDYESIRNGQRSWFALMHGAKTIEQRPTPFQSAYLSSGWTSLRNEWQGNRVWAGLNTLQAGGGHQHADRLTLLTYSQGQKLLLEKATPYNELAMRELGTLTPMHSTVTINSVSQKQGEALTPEETPIVTRLFSSSVLNYADADGHKIHPNTTLYRRAVAIIEDIIIDRFDVAGASTRDWMAYHTGGRPEVSLPLTAQPFEPVAWLQNAGGETLGASTTNQWHAQWKTGEVTSRLTMCAGEGSQVFSLLTYPVANAVVTPKDPACPALCVRRNGDGTFLAVWDAWKDKPNLQSIEQGTRPDALKIVTASHTWYMMTGPGVAGFADGVSMRSDAAFAAWRAPDAVAVVDGVSLNVNAPQGALIVSANQRGNVAAQYDGKAIATECQAVMGFDTVGGQNRIAPNAPTPAFAGTLWPVSEVHP